MAAVNDLNFCIATPNGSGSASANNILFKSIFKMGIPCGSKNMFPSNIQGMPTWYEIRANQDGFLGRKDVIDVMVAFNPETLEQDVKRPRSAGMLIYDTQDTPTLPPEESVQVIAVPATELAKTLPNPKLRAKLRNLIYVGLIARMFGIPREILSSVLSDVFGDKPDVIETNLQALDLGLNFVEENHLTQSIGELKTIPGNNAGKIVTDGNLAAGLGAIWGGANFLAWYPITPSSSLAETMEKYLPKLRRDQDGNATYAIVQAEDEIAAASMVTGAGWAGARALTATSGPGLSLMNEVLGLAYHAEIPGSYFIVQRGGPSTGLPTRTQQSDIQAMYTASHGDSRHILLLPYDISTCFEYARLCLNYADRFQTPVFLASDLDLGMNLRMSAPLAVDNPVMDRGKLVTEQDIEAQGGTFRRFFDAENDGISQRSIPGNMHPAAVYFTSGAGHNADAKRTENPQEYKWIQDKLRRKHENARSLLPQPAIELKPEATLGVISFGSSVEPVREARNRLENSGLVTSHLLLKALPASHAVREFMEKYDTVIIVEQNRDAQVRSILSTDYPELAPRLKSVLIYDGLPVTAGEVVRQVRELIPTGV